MSPNCPFIATVHLTLSCALGVTWLPSTLTLSLPALKCHQDAQAWLLEALERAQLLPVQWPLISRKWPMRHVSEQLLYSRRQQSVFQSAKHNAIHLLSLTSLCCLLQDIFPNVSVLAKYTVTHVLPRYSRVANSLQTLQWFSYFDGLLLQ